MATLTDAYKEQDRRLEARGGEIGGWKIALTTKVMQDFVGIDHPLAGAIDRAAIHDSGVRLDPAAYVHLGVESEIALRVGRDLGPDGAPYTREQVADYVVGAMAATELVDDFGCDYKTLDPLRLAAENAWNAGCVLGPEVSVGTATDWVAVVGRMRINGETVGEGRGGDVLGHPMEALAWLANHLLERGRSLRAGEVVLTGSVVPTKWPSPGDHMESEIEGLGVASLHLETR